MGKNAFSKAENAQKIHTDQLTTITNLAPRSVVKTTQALSLKQSFRMLRAEIIMTLTGWRNSIETGPLIVGMAPNYLDAQEIEEWIEEIGPTEPNDDTPRERSQRRIWILGVFAPSRSASGDENCMVRQKILKPQWTFTVGSDAAGWNFFYYNYSGSTMNVETKLLQIMVDYYGVWVI